MMRRTTEPPTRLILPLALCLAACAAAQGIPPELLSVQKQTTVIEAFRPCPEFDRHDPSNIIRHEGQYWVFYTHNQGNHAQVSIHAACSKDGFVWTDLGQALRSGPAGAWDESGTIAPYVVPHNNRVYLFYTGFKDHDLDTRQLGCAKADSPAGPWQRSSRPVLQQSAAAKAWDSGMLGDSNVIYREGTWWLYFKSRRQGENARDTHVGVAWADHITGPYRKYPDNPLFAGHAFSAWVHGQGVAALCGVITSKIRWSTDGIHFVDAGDMPSASTGLFCPDNFTNGTNTKGVHWGLERYTEQGSRGLRRFDCTMHTQRVKRQQ